MEKWEKLLLNAVAYKHKSQGLLDEAVQELMRTKGFSEEKVRLFDACFVSGGETVVRFNLDGEQNDFGLENYRDMTKEEIIYYLKKFLTNENVELLTK